MSKLPWVIAGVAGSALAALLVTSRTGRAAPHPESRAGITGERVLPPSLVLRTPGALEAYEAARTVAPVLDGLHCYCECAKNFGHRSLVTCFESDHGSQCDICIGEATLAAQLDAAGSSLDEIRRAIDERFRP